MLKTLQVPAALSVCTWTCEMTIMMMVMVRMKEDTCADWQHRAHTCTCAGKHEHMSMFSKCLVCDLMMFQPHNVSDASSLLTKQINTTKQEVEQVLTLTTFFCFTKLESLPSMGLWSRSSALPALCNKDVFILYDTASGCSVINSSTSSAAAAAPCCRPQSLWWLRLAPEPQFKKHACSVQSVGSSLYSLVLSCPCWWLQSNLFLSHRHGVTEQLLEIRF